MKLIINAFNGTEIYDDNGTVIIRTKKQANGFGGGEWRMCPVDFRDNTMMSDSIGGQHTNSVEKYYGIKY